MTQIKKIRSYLARRASGIVENGNKQPVYRVAVAESISPTANGRLLWMPILQNPIAYGETRLNNYKILIKSVTPVKSVVHE